MNEDVPLGIESLDELFPSAKKIKIIGRDSEIREYPQLKEDNTEIVSKGKEEYTPWQSVKNIIEIFQNFFPKKKEFTLTGGEIKYDEGAWTGGYCNYCGEYERAYNEQIFSIIQAPNGKINKFWKKTGRKFIGHKACGNLIENIDPRRPDHPRPTNFVLHGDIHPDTGQIAPSPKDK